MKLIISFNVNMFVAAYNTSMFVSGGTRITTDEVYALLKMSMKNPFGLTKRPDIVWLDTEETEKFASMFKQEPWDKMWAEDATDQASRIIFCEVM